MLIPLIIMQLVFTLSTPRLLAQNVGDAHHFITDFARMLSFLEAEDLEA